MDPLRWPMGLPSQGWQGLAPKRSLSMDPLRWPMGRPSQCWQSQELASFCKGNGVVRSWGGAHRVQPLIQNGYALEERSGWVERGRGLVAWEGERAGDG